MIHNWELATGHQISVENQGAQTVVTISNTSAGQQQRSINSFNTGIWLVPPEISIDPTGATLKITTPTGASIIQVRGNSIQMQSSHGGEHQSNTTTSSSFTAGMQPMEPMQPMQMGNMQMNMQPMVMKMGDMELNMGATASKQKFCTQCGTSVKSADKFCASCGHKLES
jgi:zinc-ribbon domain